MSPRDWWTAPNPSDVAMVSDERPWAGSSGEPDGVLDVVVAQVLAAHQVEGAAAERVRTLARHNPRALLDEAYEQERRYLWLREEFLRKEALADREPYRAPLGRALVGFAAAVAVLSLPALLWLVGDAVGLSTTGRLALAIGVPVAMWALLAANDEFLWSLTVDIVWGMALSAVAVPVAAVWGGTRVLGDTTAGIVGGILLTGLVAAAGAAGRALRDSVERSGYLLSRAYLALCERLATDAVEPALTEAINSVAEDLYATVLVLPQDTKAASTSVIDTSAARHLREESERRDHGSFALAGPRGAGKSTLLKRWCTGQYVGRETDLGEVRRDLGMQISAPVGYDPKEFLVYLFGRLCNEVESFASEQHRSPFDASARARRALPRLLGRHRDLTLATTYSPPDRIPNAAALLRQARAERERIRFVQSRTSEREVDARLAGAAGSFGVKGRETLRWDDVPLNYPELVDRFTWFLSETARVVALDTGEGQVRRLGRTHDDEQRSAAPGRVLIGIDELDRISDGEQAQRFLNELKAVFGVPRCYFLVSVSEDALADFELAAMGMRTVFDSAFDAIIRVDYLGLADARELVARRIIGMPEQFTALAYVLSGGLARQLVRTTNTIVKLGETPHGIRLSAVASTLAERQLHATTRAVTDRLVRAGAGGRAALIPLLDEHPAATPGALLRGEELRTFADAIRDVGTDVGDATPPGDDVRRLQADVGAMADYLATVLDVFGDGLDQARMATGLENGPGHFDTLARARRYLGANPEGAQHLLRPFRLAWGLDVAPVAAQRAPV